MNKNYLVGIGLAIAILLGGIGAFKHSSSNVVPNKTILGGTSPDFSSPYLQFGGVYHYAAMKTSLNQGTSTFCALQSPSATSTMTRGWIQLSLASTATVSMDIGQGLTPTATTTKLVGTQSVTASLPSLINASTTVGLTQGPGGDGMVFGPNTWFVVKVNGNGDNSAWAPTGDCGADWVVN